MRQKMGYKQKENEFILWNLESLEVGFFQYIILFIQSKKLAITRRFCEWVKSQLTNKESVLYLRPKQTFLKWWNMINQKKNV